MNEANSLLLALLGALLSRPQKSLFELREAELFIDGVLVPLSNPGSELTAEAKIRFLAQQVGCWNGDSKKLASAWQDVLKAGHPQTRTELLSAARSQREGQSQGSLERWSSVFRRRLTPVLEAAGRVEALEPGAVPDLRASQLELRPLLDLWPRRLLTHGTWAFVEAPLPDMEPLPLDQAWVELGIVDFASTIDLPPESNFFEQLDRRYEVRRLQVESIELLLDRLKGSAALVGPPGCGKTTLIKWVARHLINHPDDRFVLPLVIPLREYLVWLEIHPKNESLLEIAIEQCGVRDVRQKNLWIAALRDWAGPEQENVLFLLDGWDEIPAVWREKIRIQIQALLYSFSMLITSRPSAYPRSLPTTDFFEISELAPENVEILVRRWLGGHMGEKRDLAAPARLLEHLSQHTDLRRMARSTFLLTLLCGLAQRAGGLCAGGSELPISRTELYSSALRLIYASHDRRHLEARIDSKRQRQVERLALWLLADAPGAPRYVFDSQDVASAVGDEELLERFLQPSRLLDQWDAEVETHHFLHATFQEYLAARGLVSEAETTARKRIESHLHDPSWQNVFNFLAGQGGSLCDFFWSRLRDWARRPDRFGLLLIRLAQWVAEQGATDGGAKLLGLDLREPLWFHIGNVPLHNLALLSPYAHAYAGLDRIGLLERLRAASLEASPQGHRYARTLLLIHGSASSDHLVDMILGPLPGNEVAFSSSLRQHLNDEGYRRLRVAAEFGGADPRTRANAILALGYAGDTYSIPLLVKLARTDLSRSETASGLAREVVRSLAFMGGDEAILSLALMMSWSPEISWQGAVLTALGSIRSRKVSDVLLTELALRASADPLSLTILEGLWDKPIYQGREILLDLLANAVDEETRAAVVLALSQASGFEVVPAIVEAARYDPSDRVLQALERRARPLDVLWLVERFQSAESQVNERQCSLRAVLFAARAFRGSELEAGLEATAANLIRLALTSDPSLARDAVQHAHLAGETAAPILLQACLNLEADSRVRTAACQGLGRLRYRPAIPAFLTLLRDRSAAEKGNVVSAAAQALARDRSGHTARRAR